MKNLTKRGVIMLISNCVDLNPCLCKVRVGKEGDDHPGEVLSAVSSIEFENGYLGEYGTGSIIFTVLNTDMFNRNRGYDFLGKEVRLSVTNEGGQVLFSQMVRFDNRVQFSISSEDPTIKAWVGFSYMISDKFF